MTQEETDILFELTALIFMDPYFKDESRTLEEVQDWVRLQIGEKGIHTIPAGTRWGALVGKQNYESYNKKHKKL